MNSVPPTPVYAPSPEYASPVSHHLLLDWNSATLIKLIAGGGLNNREFVFK